MEIMLIDYYKQVLKIQSTWQGVDQITHVVNYCIDSIV